MDVLDFQGRWDGDAFGYFFAGNSPSEKVKMENFLWKQK
jgi:hypothetical protein